MKKRCKKNIDLTLSGMFIVLKRYFSTCKSSLKRVYFSHPNKIPFLHKIAGHKVHGFCVSLCSAYTALKQRGGGGHNPP